MKKLLLLSFALFVMQISFGQLSGTKSIPGDYTTIEAAIVALNAQGVGSGGVTFNVAAGHTETFTVPAAGLITATGTVANNITFQKSGAGANPMVTAATPGTAAADYIFCLSGSDYVTFNGIDVQENAANTTSAMQMEWGYAILKVSETNGSQNITVKNCAITLNPANTASYAIYSNNHTTASTTQLVVTSISGTNSNNKFFGLTISNTFNGFYLYGRADAVPYAFYDQNNEIGVGGANTITGLGNTGGTTTSYGLYGYYQNGVKIANNTFTGTSALTTGSLYVMYLLTATNANVDIYNNTISMTYAGTGSFYGIYGSGFGSSGTTNTVNIYNNSVINNSFPNLTSGSVYFIYISTGGVTANFYGNNVSGNTVGSAAATATGTIYYIYFASSPSTAGTTNMYNNTVANNARIQSVLGSGTTYVFYNGGSGNVFNQYNNTINNITIAANGTTYVYYNLFSGATKNVHHNTITNILNANGTIYGFYNANGTVAGNFYDNKIQNINMTSAAGILYGVYQSSGINQFYYNNYISELKAPIATGNPAIYGMYMLGATTIGAFNNTIYLNASSTSSTFGVTGIWASTTPNFELRNNIVINNSTPGASGRVVAYQRSTTTLTSYTATSNNNNFNAGTPGAINLIYYDGTNSDQTLAAYKARVSPRDASSITELSPFVNITSFPYNLHLQTSVPTQCESGGATVSTPVNIIDDFDDEPRYPNAGYPNNVSSPAAAPDIGADEFAGILLDITAPNISFSPLANTSGTGARTLTTSITDPSGVPTAGTGRPVLYWKINAGSYNAVTGTWVSGSTYTFTFGTGVVLNDVVSYYVVAQDNVTPTPNVGSNPSGGASGFTANPPACSTPPTTPFSYIIVGTLAGTYSVGAGQTYANLTAAIADLNLKEVIAPVTFELWDATYNAETLPLIINPYAGMNPSRPVIFKPKAGVTSTVTGSSANGILVVFGADFITFDGSNSGGTDRSLTWENTNNVANAYVLGIFHNGVKGAQNNTIKNCVVKAGGKVNNTWAIILNAAGGDFDNTVIQNNQLLNAMVGMQFVGLTTGITNNGLVTQNVFGSSDDALTLGNIGINVSNVEGLVISNNTFQNFKTNTNPKGINIGANTLNTTITGNIITGMVYTGTGGYGGKGIDINTGLSASNMTISNNAISQLLGDGWSTFSSDAIVGIRVLGATGGLNIYHNSINLTGTLIRAGTADVSAALYLVGTATNIDVRDNIFLNSLENTTGVATAYSIYSDAPAGAFTNINYNDYWVSGPEGVLGYLGVQRTTLAAWQGATGQDANSKNVDPLFVSATNLLASATGLDNQGVYLASVLKDITGVSRTNPPDIGAYEFGTNPAVVTLDATGIDCSGGTLNGTINANGLMVNSFFDYGPTTAYGSSVAGVPATVTGTTTTAISVALAMPAGTTYHFRARGVTSAGVTVYGNNMTITSSGSSTPLATTLAASAITDNSATLNGIVNAFCNSTTVTFEYGETLSYGFSVTATPSPVNGGVNTAVSANITGLTLNTLYHFRVVASSTAGTTYGADLTLTTGANPPIVTTNPATNLGNFTARLNGTVNASNQSTTVNFQYGLTTSYGTTVAGVPGTVTGNTPTAVYADISGLTYNTTYHFRVVGQNSAGTTYGADQVFTTLCPVPEAAGAITGPVSICQNTSGHVYTVPPVNYAYNGYVWTLPAGGTITAGAGTNSITVSYSSSAVSGNVSVYGTSVCGNGSPSSLAVTLNPLPVPVITGPAVACISSTYTYSTAAGMSAYVWTVSAGGQIMTGAGTNSITVKWNNSGAQSVSVSYTSAFGCPAAAPSTLNVAVSTLPSPTIAGSDLMCANSGWHVYTTQAGFSNYVWTVTSGGIIVSGQGTYQIEVNWTVGGAQTVTANYANASGCSASTPASFAVTVMPLPGGAGPVQGPDDICAGSLYVAYDTPPIQNADNYIWTLPAGATIVEGENTQHIKVDFALDASSGDISVYGENLCGTGHISPPFSLTVTPIPPAPVATADEFFVLTSSAGAGNQWYFNGVMIEGANGQFYQAEEEGTYYTIVTVNGCVSEESNHVEVIFTGLGELKGSSFSIYPIPNDGKFTATIVITEADTFSISVYNELGMKVYEVKDVRVNGKAQQNIDLSNPAKGIYTVVFQGNNQTVIRKVLVTK